MQLLGHFTSAAGQYFCTLIRSDTWKLQRLKEKNGQIKFCFFSLTLKDDFQVDSSRYNGQNHRKCGNLETIVWLMFISLSYSRMAVWSTDVLAFLTTGSTILATTWVKHRRIVEPTPPSIAWSLDFLGSNTASIDGDFSVLERKQFWKRKKKVIGTFLQEARWDW